MDKFTQKLSEIEAKLDNSPSSHWDSDVSWMISAVKALSDTDDKHKIEMEVARAELDRLKADNARLQEVVKAQFYQLKEIADLRFEQTEKGDRYDAGCKQFLSANRIAREAVAYSLDDVLSRTTTPRPAKD